MSVINEFLLVPPLKVLGLSASTPGLDRTGLLVSVSLNTGKKGKCRLGVRHSPPESQEILLDALQVHSRTRRPRVSGEHRLDILMPGTHPSQGTLSSAGSRNNFSTWEGSPHCERPEARDLANIWVSGEGRRGPNQELCVSIP
jgi:hypothetical protein